MSDESRDSEKPSEQPSPPTHASEPASDRAPIVKIPQPHGGALNSRGTVGNKAGRNGGRPPSALRALARDKLDVLIPKLDKLARGRKTKDSDKIRAIEVLARVGLDRGVSIEDVRVRLKQQTEEIFALLPREQADALVAALREIWRTL